MCKRISNESPFVALRASRDVEYQAPPVHAVVGDWREESKCGASPCICSIKVCVSLLKYLLNYYFKLLYFTINLRIRNSYRINSLSLISTQYQHARCADLLEMPHNSPHVHFNALSPENIPYLAHIMLKRATPQYHKYTSSQYPAKHTENSAVFVSVPENLLSHPLLNIPCDTIRHKHRLGAYHDAASPTTVLFLIH